MLLFLLLLAVQSITIIYISCSYIMFLAILLWARDLQQLYTLPLRQLNALWNSTFAKTQFVEKHWIYCCCCTCWWQKLVSLSDYALIIFNDLFCTLNSSWKNELQNKLLENTLCWLIWYLTSTMCFNCYYEVLNFQVHDSNLRELEKRKKLNSLLWLDHKIFC